MMRMIDLRNDAIFKKNLLKSAEIAMIVFDTAASTNNRVHISKEMLSAILEIFDKQIENINEKLKEKGVHSNGRQDEPAALPPARLPARIF